MVGGTDLFLGLFNNLAIFIVMAAIYGVMYRYLGKSPWLTRQIALGIFFGLFAVGCMYVKLPVAEGVIVDQRNTIAALSGAFGGPLSACITALMAAGNRVQSGRPRCFRRYYRDLSVRSCRFDFLFLTGKN